MAGRLLSTIATTAVFFLLYFIPGNDGGVLDTVDWGAQEHCGDFRSYSTRNPSLVEVFDDHTGSLLGVGSLVLPKNGDGSSDLVLTSSGVAKKMKIKGAHPMAIIAGGTKLDIAVHKYERSHPLAVLQLSVRFPLDTATFNPLCLPIISQSTPNGRVIDARMTTLFSHRSGYIITVEDNDDVKVSATERQEVSKYTDKFTVAYDGKIAAGSPFYSSPELTEGRSYLWGVYDAEKRVFHPVAPYVPAITHARV